MLFRRRPLRPLFLLLLIIVNAQSIYSGQSKQTDFTNVISIAREEGRAGVWNGVVFVRIGGRIILNEAFGLANSEFNVRNAVDTRFKTFSVSKQFTAIAAMHLVQERRLDLDVPIAVYLPDVPRSWEKVTMRRLLQHTAGVPNGFEEVWCDTWETVDSRTNLQTFAALKDKLPGLEFEPGTQWRYSNMGYIIAGCVIEKLAGESFEAYVERTVFRSARMFDTLYDSRTPTEHKEYSGNAVVPRLANGYNGVQGSLETAYSKEFEETPAGGVISTVGDLAAYAAAYEEGKLLPSSLKAEMENGAFVVNPHFSYGIGWEFRSIAGEKAIFHSGGSNGFQSELLIIPSKQITIVVMSNHGFDDAEEFSAKLAEAAISSMQRSASRQESSRH